MIHVVGSVNLDYVARLQNLPRPGETVLGTALEKSPGGKGANQALAARRAGAVVCLTACIGDDGDGRAATALLDVAGVDLSGLVRVAVPTGIALIQIGATGENAIAVLPGANAQLTATMVKPHLAELTPADIVVLQQEVPQQATQAAILAARATGATSILNVAPVLSDSAELAAQADIVIANETEFQRISGAEPSPEAAEAWCRANGCGLALTLGADGAFLVGFGDLLHVRPRKIAPVDTVGAGDTFVGYLAAGLHAGNAPLRALQFAVAASAQACLKDGAQAAIPLTAEVIL